MKSKFKKKLSLILLVMMIFSMFTIVALATSEPSELTPYYTVVSDTKMSSDLAEFMAVSILTNGGSGYQGSKNFVDHGESIGSALKLGWRYNASKNEITSKARYIYTGFNSGKKLPIAEIWGDGYLKFDIYVPSTAEKPSPTIPGIRLHNDNANTTKPMAINTQVPSYNAWHTVVIKLSDFEMAAGTVAGQNVNELRLQWGNNNGDANFTDVYMKNMAFCIPKGYMTVEAPIVTEESVTLKWNCAEATSYSIYCNEELLVEGLTSKTYVAPPITTKGIQNYKIVCFDADGNQLNSKIVSSVYEDAIPYQMIFTNGALTGPISKNGTNGSKSQNMMTTGVLLYGSSPSITAGKNIMIDVPVSKKSDVSWTQDSVRIGPETRFPAEKIDVTKIKDNGYLRFLVYADTDNEQDLPNSIRLGLNPEPNKDEDGASVSIVGQIRPKEWSMVEIPIYAESGALFNEATVDKCGAIANVNIGFPISPRTEAYNLYIQEMGFYSDTLAFNTVEAGSGKLKVSWYGDAASYKVYRSDSPNVVLFDNLTKPEFVDQIDTENEGETDLTYFIKAYDAVGAYLGNASTGPLKYSSLLRQPVATAGTIGISNDGKSELTIKFNKRMNENTLLPEAFTANGLTCSNVTFVNSPDPEDANIIKTTATLYFAEQFDLSTTYTLSVADTVKCEDGKPLTADNRTFTFKTVDLQDRVYIESINKSVNGNIITIMANVTSIFSKKDADGNELDNIVTAIVAAKKGDKVYKVGEATSNPLARGAAELMNVNVDVTDVTLPTGYTIEVFFVDADDGISPLCEVKSF